MSDNLSAIEDQFPPSYFEPYLQIIIDALHDPRHEDIPASDVIEAFNVLSNRIRTCGNIITSPHFRSPLSAFCRHAEDIVAAVQCHLRNWILYESPPRPWVENSYEQQDYEDDSEEEDSEELKDQFVLDNALICQYALRFVSDIFAIPALYSNFTNLQLLSMFHDVLFICDPPERPIFNIDKLCAMTIWIIKVQRLPFEVTGFEPYKIAQVLLPAIQGHYTTPSAKADAFKATHCLLRQYPSFSEAFLSLLSPTLNALLDHSVETRCHAALALSGFALAKSTYAEKEPYPIDKVSKVVSEFISKKGERREPDNRKRLCEVLGSAIADERAWQGAGPSFATLVQSCLIYLLDHHLFWTPSVLKTVFDAFRLFHTCQNPDVAKLQPRLYRFVVYAFDRIPLTVEAHPGKALRTISQRRDAACAVVSQDLRVDTASMMLKSLMQSSKSDLPIPRGDRSRVFDVLVQMSKNVSSRRVVPPLLSRLLDAVGSTSTPPHAPDGSMDAFLPFQLIDGSILGRQPAHLPTDPDTCQVCDFDPLDEAHILEGWGELMEAWTNVVRGHLQDTDPQLSEDLVKTWQNLLLVQGKFSSGHLRLTLAPVFSNRIATILVDLGPPSTTTLSPRRQARYLSLVTKLWTTVTNVFEKEFLRSSAELVLASILKRKYDLAKGTVKEEWVRVCSTLIEVGSPTLLHVLRVRSETGEDSEATRLLWSIMAKHGPCVGLDEDWVALVVFLAMPLGLWVMSSNECNDWKDLFGRADSLARSSGEPGCALVRRFFDLLDQKQRTWLKETPVLLRHLVSCLARTDNEQTPVPYTEFLAFLEEVLLDAYSPTYEEKVHFLDMLSSLGTYLSKMSPSDVISTLEVIQSSIGRWLEDPGEVLSENEVNKLMEDVYCPIIELLIQAEPSASVLSTLSPFLYSVFLRGNTFGMQAFGDFWRVAFPKKPGVPKADVPFLVKTALASVWDMLDSGFSDVSSSVSSPPARNQDKTRVLQRFDEFATPVLKTFGGVGLPFPRPSQPSPLQPRRLFPGIRTPSRPITAHHASSNRQTRPIPMNQLLLRKRAGEEEVVPSSSPKRRRTDDGGPPLGFISEKARGKRKAVDVGLDTDGEEGLDQVPGSSSPNPFLSPDLSRHHVRLGMEEEDANPGLMSPFSLPGIHNQPLFVSSRAKKLKVEGPPLAPRGKSGHGKDNPKPNPTRTYTRPVILDDDDIHVVPDSEEPLPVVGLGHGDTDVDELEHDDDPVDDLRPSRGRERYHSVPELSHPSFTPDEYPRPLRRHRTSPSPPPPPLKKTSSEAVLEKLQEVYAAVVTGDGDSQIDVEAVLHHKRLIKQIEQVLDEQMCSKIPGASNRR